MSNRTDPFNKLYRSCPVRLAPWCWSRWSIMILPRQHQIRHNLHWDLAVEMYQIILFIQCKSIVILGIRRRLKQSVETPSSVGVPCPYRPWTSRNSWRQCRPGWVQSRGDFNGFSWVKREYFIHAGHIITSAPRLHSPRIQAAVSTPSSHIVINGILQIPFLSGIQWPSQNCFHVVSRL